MGGGLWETGAPWQENDLRMREIFTGAIGAPMTAMPRSFGEQNNGCIKPNASHCLINGHFSGSLASRISYCELSVEIVQFLGFMVLGKF